MRAWNVITSYYRGVTLPWRELQACWHLSPWMSLMAGGPNFIPECNCQKHGRHLYFKFHGVVTKRHFFAFFTSVYLYTFLLHQQTIADCSADFYFTRSACSQCVLGYMYRIGSDYAVWAAVLETLIPKRMCVFTIRVVYSTLYEAPRSKKVLDVAINVWCTGQIWPHSKLTTWSLSMDISKLQFL